MGAMNATPSLLSGRDLARRHGAVVALAEVSIDVWEGEFVAIVGPNGSGKSTLLRALAGVATGDGVAGAVRHLGEALGREAWARVRAFVPQRPESSVDFSAREVVALGRFARGADAAAIDRALAAVGLSDRAGRATTTLSGGERQRVAIARALAQVDGAERPVLLLDEPFSGIDPGEVARVVSALRAVARRGAVLVSLHDPTLARAIATRAIAMRGGRVVADGAAGEVLSARILSEAYGHPIEERGAWLAPSLVDDAGEPAAG